MTVVHWYMRDIEWEKYIILFLILQGHIQMLDHQKRGTRAGHLSHLPTVCQRAP